MLRTTAWFIAALAAGLVAGCGKQPAPGAAATGVQEEGDGQSRDGASGAVSEGDGAARSGAASGAEDGVFAPLLDDVERARGVQQTVDEQAERLRREIEKAEGGGDQ